MKRILIFLLFIFPVLAYTEQTFFRTTTPLPSGRQMYGAVSVGQYLYVIGGNVESDIYTNSVIKAKVNPDGTLGSWEETTPLSSPRSYINNSTISLNGNIYVVQGLNGVTDEKYRDIAWTRPGENGNLAPWRKSMPCPGEGVSCGVAIVTPGFIHLIGGSMGQSQPTSNVWSAQVGADGSIVSWEASPPLPVPLWFHCGGLADGKAWVWSGLLESLPSSVNPSVYFAPVDSTGRLGAWQDSGSQLPRGFYSSSCAVTGDYLLSFCPRYAQGEARGDVWYAAVSPQGLSGWNVINCDLPAKHFTGVATNYLLGYVYLPGGRLNRETLEFDKTVYYFSIVAQDEGVAQPAEAGYAQSAASASPPAPTAAVQAMTYSSSPSRAVANQPETPQPSQRFPGFCSYEDLKQRYFSSPRPTVIYFHSDANQDCGAQAAILSAFQPQAYMDRVITGEVNADLRPDVARQYGVTRVPYWVFYDATGNLVHQNDGVLPLSELTRILGLMSR